MKRTGCLTMSKNNMLAIGDETYFKLSVEVEGQIFTVEKIKGPKENENDFYYWFKVFREITDMFKRRIN